jgi:murein DD-endopeptidase MepM/ murein hydrolase activator NlpD
MNGSLAPIHRKFRQHSLHEGPFFPFGDRSLGPALSSEADILMSVICKRGGRVRLSASLIGALALSFSAATLASADDGTPGALPTSAPIMQPTSGPVADTPVVPVSTLAPDTSPVVVQKEQTTPVTRINHPGVAESTPVASGPGTSQENTPGPSVPGSATHPPPDSTTTHNPGPGTGQPLTTTGPAMPVSPDQTASQYTSYDLTQLSRAAAAPVQLQCAQTHSPAAGPFLQFPFAGWSEVASFLDHDSPDYSVDGKIVLSNGLTATSTNGQASDLFPSYWSTRLRQYVNYDGHNGYDFSISYQPVLAAAAGTVRFAGWNSSDPYAGYGQMILINHHNGYVTLYGHLSELRVKKGDRVSAGQTIGISGTTGHSSGPHLHFSVFHDCNVTDPYGWTGQGQDPLSQFDGETSNYLWLPGHDPLLLNLPPQWPTFPLGLGVPALPGDGNGLTPRGVPTVDRLLLLSLPPPGTSPSFSPGEAVARAEAQITQEAGSLAPELESLKQQGLVDSYQVIPAAAAVWVRGSASSTQLEDLTGVASLTGVTPKDLAAASSGLAHSVLIQIGNQQAPALWPVGFRSAFHAWRPTLSVLTGQAFVTGITLPGQRTVVSIHRGGFSPGATAAFGDPQTGGFVAMLHDVAGGSVSVQPGDLVEVQSGGRSTSIHVVSLQVKARTHLITARSPSDATVSLIVSRASNADSTQLVLGATSRGNIRVPVAELLPAGTLAVASIVDTGGDQQSVAAFVPGLVLTEGTPFVRGWAVGHAPVILVSRGGRVLAQRHIRPATDGSFQLALGSPGRPIDIAAGDTVTIGSRLHQRLVQVPALTAPPSAAGKMLDLTGPVGRPVRLELQRAGGPTWVRFFASDTLGRRLVRVPDAAIRLGDSVVLETSLASGDTVRSVQLSDGVLVHVGTATISGTLKPGSVDTIRVLNASGRYEGGSVVTTDPRSGRFEATVMDLQARRLRIEPGMRIDIRGEFGHETWAVSGLSLRLDAQGYAIVGRASTSARAKVDQSFRGRPAHTEYINTGRYGRFRVSLRSSEMSMLEAVTMTVASDHTFSEAVTIRLAARSDRHSQCAQAKTVGTVGCGGARHAGG